AWVRSRLNRFGKLSSRYSITGCNRKCPILPGSRGKCQPAVRAACKIRRKRRMIKRVACFVPPRPILAEVSLFAPGALAFRGVFIFTAAGGFCMDEFGLCTPDHAVALFADAQAEVHIVEGDGVAVLLQPAQTLVELA